MPSEKKRMRNAEKDCVYTCDVCGCEIVRTTPSRGHLIFCEEVMCCCLFKVNDGRGDAIGKYFE